MAWIPVIASIGGALIGAMGQRDTNDTNLQIQENNSAFNAEQSQITRDFNDRQGLLARQFNADQAATNRQFQDLQVSRQMQFQQENADTVWQRATRDMAAAGLNPMLAYNQGGNPAAQGGAASGSQAQTGLVSGGSAAMAGSPGSMINTFAAAGNAASQWANMENIRADTKKKEAEEELTRAEIQKKPVDQETSRSQGEYLKAQTVKAMYDTDLSAAMKKKVEAEVDEVIARTKNLSADTRLKQVNEILQKYDIPRMKAEASYFESEVGRTSPHNKYGPQTPFRLLEGLGERIINRGSATSGRENPATFQREQTQ